MSRIYPYLEYKYAFTCPAARSEALTLSQYVMHSFSMYSKDMHKTQSEYSYRSTCRDLMMSGAVDYFKRIPTWRLYDKFRIRCTLSFTMNRAITKTAQDVVRAFLNSNDWGVEYTTDKLSITSCTPERLPEMTHYSAIIHYLLLAANLMSDDPETAWTLKDVNKYILYNPVDVFEREKPYAKSIGLFTAFFGYLLDMGVFPLGYCSPESVTPAAAGEKYALLYPSDFVKFYEVYNLNRAMLNVPFYTQFTNSGRIRASHTSSTKVSDIFESKLDDKGQW
jgi:hypothetical protein